MGHATRSTRRRARRLAATVCAPAAVVAGVVATSPGRPAAAQAAPIPMIDDDFGGGRVLFQDTFDDGTTADWRVVHNGRVTTSELVERSSQLVGRWKPNSNANGGIVGGRALAARDLSAGFSARFRVNSITGPDPTANGAFVGLASSSTSFYRDSSVSNFGLVFFGSNPRTGSAGGVGLVVNDTGNGGASVAGAIVDSKPNSIDLNSFKDGFDAEIWADSTGWGYSITGLTTSRRPVTITGQGDWPGGRNTFQTVFGSSNWYPIVSTQTGTDLRAQSITLDDVTVEAAGDTRDWLWFGNSIGTTSTALTAHNSSGLAQWTTSQPFSNRGIVSARSFNPNAMDGFSLRFDVDGIGSAPTGNGLFAGMVASNDRFHRSPTNKNFGLIFFGADNRTGSGGGFSLVYGDNNGSGRADLIVANSDSAGDVNLDSLLDGFVASIDVSAEGWSYQIEGLRTAAGQPTTFTGRGTWADLGTSYAALFGSDNSWHVGAANQVGTGGAQWMQFDRISAGDRGQVAPSWYPADSDDDTYNDQAEIAFGTDPNSAASIPDNRRTTERPNVVVIYADDLGLGDLSVYGRLFNTPSSANTPNIDRLAREGVTFTQAHSSNAVCTPSRYALMTGKYNWREFNGITLHYGGLMGGEEVPRPDDVTIAEYLKDFGYDTAAFGKWHLGGAWYTRDGARIKGNPTDPNTVDWARPITNHATDNGFDTFKGLATTINIGPYVYLDGNRVQYWDKSLNGGAGGYRNATNRDRFTWFTKQQLDEPVYGSKDSRPSLGDPSYTQNQPGPKLIDDVEQWFGDRKASGDKDPFFAYVSLYSPHLPWAVTPAFQGKTEYSYGDYLTEMDAKVGRVLKAIDAAGYRRNTMVVFTSDNGPETLAMSESLRVGRDANTVLRGVKRDVWEGGTRVPMIVRWPYQAARGITTDELVWQGDIYATLSAYLLDEPGPNIAPDGESFLNVLHGQQKPATRRPSIVSASVRGDLGLKTLDGWKFIDGTGGGGYKSWDSANQPIPSPAGVNRGDPKQLFQLYTDIGEDNNLITRAGSASAARRWSKALTGRDLLGELDAYRAQTTLQRFGRAPDNDGDGMSNADEIAAGRDPNSPLDASG